MIAFDSLSIIPESNEYNSSIRQIVEPIAIISNKYFQLLAMLSSYLISHKSKVGINLNTEICKINDINYVNVPIHNYNSPCAP